MGLIPGHKTNILHAMQHNQKKRKKNSNSSYQLLYLYHLQGTKHFMEVLDNLYNDLKKYVLLPSLEYSSVIAPISHSLQSFILVLVGLK